MFLVQNVVEVPLSFHRQWMYRYPNYVLFNCDGTKHFIRVRRYGRKCFFVYGLKDFRRAYNVNKSVMVRFIAFDINTTLSVDVMGPIHRQVRVRSVVSTRRHFYNWCHRRHDSTQAPFGGFYYAFYHRKMSGLLNLCALLLFFNIAMSAHSFLY